MWLAYGVALVGTAALVAVQLWLWFQPDRNPAHILFLLPVMLSAYLGGLGPRLVSTGLGALGT